MNISREKLALCILKELSSGNTEISMPEDCDVTANEFGNVVSELQEMGYVRGAIIIQGGFGNPVLTTVLNGATVTLSGEKFLSENSAAMKTYRGLKELYSWIPFI